MTPDALQLYKLIILYFLKKAKQPIPNAILSDFILDSGYTDYFSIQQTLAELTEDGMIHSEQTHKASYYTIATLGEDTLNFFGNQLPDDTCEQIDRYLEENHVAIIENTSIKTDYTQINPKEYLATCSLFERGSKIFEVTLNVPSEEEAVDVCNRFKNKNEEVYSSLLRILSVD